MSDKPEVRSPDDNHGNKVISQEEFSALLEKDPSADAASAGSHFAGADHIVRGQLPNLDVANERFSRNLKTSLFELLRREVEVAIEPQRVMRFSDYQASLPVPTNLNLVTIPQLSCQGLLTVEEPLVAGLTDIFYGGNGAAANSRQEKEFTPTEKRLAETLLGHMLRGLGEAWAPIMRLDWQKKKVESNPHFASITSPSEKVMVCGFVLDAGDCRGRIHVVVPMDAIASIRSVLSSAVHSDRESSVAAWRSSIETGLRGTKVGLRAVLCETEVSLKELLQLKAGDVLEIDLPILSTVFVGESPIYSATFGVHNGYNSVRLVEKMQNEGELPLPGVKRT